MEQTNKEMLTVSYIGFLNEAKLGHCLILGYTRSMDSNGKWVHSGAVTIDMVYPYRDYVPFVHLIAQFVCIEISRQLIVNKMYTERMTTSDSVLA